MNKRPILIFILSSLLVSGCTTGLEVFSLEGLKTKGYLDRVALPDLTGRWALKRRNEVWEFTPVKPLLNKDGRNAKAGHYDLLVIDSSGRQGVHLAEIFYLERSVFLQVSSDLGHPEIIPFYFPLASIYKLTMV